MFCKIHEMCLISKHGTVHPRVLIDVFPICLCLSTLILCLLNKHSLEGMQLPEMLVVGSLPMKACSYHWNYLHWHRQFNIHVYCLSMLDKSRQSLSGFHILKYIQQCVRFTFVCLSFVSTKSI